MTRFAFAGTFAVAILGCADGTAPRSLVGGPTASVAVAEAQHQIVGSGHVQQAAGLREFTFHAVERPDGSVSGSYKIVLPSGLFFEADVTCLSVDANTGWVGGVIRATNAAAVIIGSASTVYVIDNGEGNAQADIVSIATFNGAAGGDVAFCNDRPLALQPLAVANGNVQVR
jgi:hypothetical protein